METLTVDGSLEHLSDIRNFLNEISAKAGLSPEKSYNLSLAIDEIATNVIVHGYQENDIKSTLDVTAQVDPQKLRVTIIDQGPKFDPLGTITEASQDLDKPLEERPIGGLGIYLAIKSVDKFSYEWANGKNHTIFDVNL